MPVYVSTSCLKKSKDLFQTLDTYSRLGIENVELGVYAKPIEDLGRLRDYGFNYAVHHYFPPAKKGFIVNLASSDGPTLQKSREQMKASIDFCSEYDIGFFSFHSGFRSDPDESLRFDKRRIQDYEASFTTFKESLQLLADHAGSSDVALAIENNVLARENLVDGENKLLLMCEYNEFIRLFNEMDARNLGLLLDTGHLKVTAKTIGFSMREFVEETRGIISAFHVHENNGLRDDHLGIRSGDDVLPLMKGFKNIPIILESFCRDEKELMESAAALDSLKT